MKIILNIFGCMLVFSGSVWALQGMGFLPGKLMGGHKEWIVYGALAVAAGVAILMRSKLRKPQ